MVEFYARQGHAGGRLPCGIVLERGDSKLKFTGEAADGLDFGGETLDSDLRKVGSP